MRDLFAPLGWAYSGMAKIRNRLYDEDFLKRQRLPKPVISVGNLTVGGTGKTPLVDVLLTQIEGQSKKACVLTRGYKRGTKLEPYIVNPDSKTSEGGDEPVWLARRHPKSVVAVGADRVASAENAGLVDIYILDDGLQHLKIKRDLDIVLLDSTRPLWHYRPLPWGYGRESFSGIARSDFVILTRTNQASRNNIEALKAQVARFGVSHIFESQVVAGQCRDIWSENVINPRGKNLLLVSGIANPESFEKLAESLGGTVKGHEVYPDHFEYSQETIDRMGRLAKEKGADMILTTEKDSVKWRELKGDAYDLHFGFLTIELKFNPALPRIYDLAIDRFS